MLGKTLALWSALLFAGAAALTYTIALDPARYSEQPYCFEIGAGGSTTRGRYLVVGSDAYLWWAHTQDSVVCGPDPGDTETALAGMTGTLVALPAGLSTSQAHAALVATALSGMTGINSAAAAAAGNSDGGWNVEVETDGRALAMGTRAYASRGAAGLHGSHIYRMPRAGEVSGSQSFEITRVLSTRIDIPPTDAVIWAVQIALGTAIDAGTQRPRIQYWASTSASDTGAGTEMVYDFGQIPAAQMVVGGVATIPLTAAQSAALRTAIDAAAGTNHWLSVHSTGGTRYNTIPIGAGLEGETADESLCIAPGGAVSAETTATTWTAGGSSFGFTVPMRLVYDVDICTTGEHHTFWGGFATYAEYPGAPYIGLPDTLTTQTGDIAGLEGARILRIGGGQATGSDVRRGFLTGGDTTLDAADVDGATLLVDCGLTSATGAISYADAPTGSDTVRVPSVAAGLWIAYKGQGAAGPGEGGPGPFSSAGTIVQPTSWVRRFGVNIGRNPMEVDAVDGAGYGDDATPFEDPVTPTSQSYPGNLPSSRGEFWHPAVAVALV